MNRDFDYENNNIGYDCQYTKADGGGIKCKNYIVCDSVLPKWWFECKGHYLCTRCDMMDCNILKVSTNLECPICLEINLCISQPKCDHSICISCFKRCYYGDENRDNEPIFPYSEEIEDEYYDNTEDIKWVNYPLIQFYNEEWNKWNDEKEEKYEKEEYLRKCSICRK
jgi:hypothetical protein